MKKIIFRAVLVFFLCSVATVPVFAKDKPVPPLKALETLKAKDPEVKKLGEWQKIRTELEREKPDAKVLFALGNLNERLFLKRGDQQALDRAVRAYERVPRRFPGNELADDALLALGDLRAKGMKDQVGARAAYFEILDMYPKGNVARVAQERIDGKKKPQPSSTPTPAPTPQHLPPPVEKTPAAPAPTLAPTPEVLAPPTPKPGTGQDLVVTDEVYRRPLIVIDPGHGGEDVGAKGVAGIVEKEIVLSISKELERLLQDRLRAKTFLTRTNDTFIPLPERTKLANERNADLFISIHANASEYKTAQGIETYYLDNTKDKASLKLAERENASLQFGGGSDDVGFILSDLIQNVKLDDSISLAHHVQDSLHGTLARYYQGVVNLGVKKAPFYVLVGAHMPCVLVEVSFIDHPLEGQRLGEERYQRLIAQSLYEGVRAFFLRREKGKQ